LAGIAEHFGTNIVRLLQDNVQVFAITKRGKPDLTTPLVDKQLLVCGITNVQDTASLGGFVTSSIASMEILGCHNMYVRKQQVNTKTCTLHLLHVMSLSR
jgi:hypothetical protein